MKIAAMSDLHLEYDARYFETNPRGSSTFYDDPPQPRADFLVLAGDIHSGPLAFDWARLHFAIPTVLIAGNHEPYNRELFRTIAFNRKKSETSDDPILFLERASWEGTAPDGQPVRFIGATLWTDFELYGTPDLSMALALRDLEDFKVINLERGYRTRKLRPADTLRVHVSSVEFITEELRRPFAGTTVVVTHHAPSPRSISPTFKSHPLNPAFVSNLEELMRTFEPALWIHGHMHESFDYTIGRTRVVCNPRGYFPDQLNPRFDPIFVVEI